MYRQLLDTTSDTITQRARLYRNFVIATALLLVVPPVFGLVTGQAGWLWLWAAAVPLVGAFCWRDAVLLSSWCRQVDQAWVEGGIEFGPLRQALEARRDWPEATVQGMWQALAAGPSMVTPDGRAAEAGAEDRLAVSVSRERNRRDQQRRLVVKVAVASLILAVVAGLSLQIR